MVMVFTPPALVKGSRAPSVRSHGTCTAWSNCELCTISAEPEDVPVRLTFEALAH